MPRLQLDVQQPGTKYACPAYPNGWAGRWRAPHTIYMAQACVDERRVVQHEMLHDLLRRSDHPPVCKS